MNFEDFDSKEFLNQAIDILRKNEYIKKNLTCSVNSVFKSVKLAKATSNANAKSGIMNAFDILMKNKSVKSKLLEKTNGLMIFFKSSDPKNKSFKFDITQLDSIIDELSEKLFKTKDNTSKYSANVPMHGGVKYYVYIIFENNDLFSI